MVAAPGAGVSSLYALTGGKLLSSVGLGAELMGLEYAEVQSGVFRPVLTL